MLYRRFIPLLAVAALLIAGCIHADKDGCATGCYLTFEYSHNPEYADKFESEVGMVTVYAFGEDGVFVGEYSSPIEEITRSGGKMKLPLKSGNYTLLIWGGTLDTYSVGEETGGSLQKGLRKDITEIGDFRLWIHEDEKATASHPCAKTPADLYFSRADVAVTYGSAEQYHIRFIKNTSLVRIILVERLETRSPETENNDGEVPYGMILCGTDTLLNQGNSIPAGAPEYIYNPLSAGRLTGQGYEIEYKTTRMERAAEDTLTLEFGRSGDILPDGGKIIEMIKNLKDSSGNYVYPTQSELDREEEFNIRIEVLLVPGTGEILELTILINGWVYKTVIPIIG